VASVTGTGTTVKNLTNRTAYSFKVTAVNKAGEGPASGTASAPPTAKVTKPGLPNGLTASPGNGKVTLSWKAPGSGGGTGISGYEIYRGTSPGGGNPALRSNASLVAGTSFTVTRPDQRHQVLLHRGRGQPGEAPGRQVGRGVGHPGGRCVGLGQRVGVGERVGDRASHGVTLRRSHGHRDRHSGSTVGLTATPGNGEVGLSWTAPASAGGAPPASYDVYQGTSSGFTLAPRSPAPATRMSR